MRIISKFKDYYDSALSHGIDSSLIYVRKTEEVAIPINYGEIIKNGQCVRTPYNRKKDRIELKHYMFVVLLAGKAWHGLRLRVIDPLLPKHPFLPDANKKTVYVYSVDELLKIIFIIRFA